LQYYWPEAIFGLQRSRHDGYREFIEFILHLDRSLCHHRKYEIWTYLLLFLIIFCETGLVVAPFLPGDSLLFACGSLASIGTFKFFRSAGCSSSWPRRRPRDTINYWIGHALGPKVFQNENNRFFKKGVS